MKVSVAMTFTISGDDLKKYIDEIVENESLLFGKEGFDHEDIFHFDRHPRYSISMLITLKEELAGYAFLKHLRPGIVRVLRLCIIPGFRRRGYGKNLHDAVLLTGHEYRLRVPERWLESQIWLRDAGWLAVGIASDGIEFRTFIDSDPFVVS